MVNYAVIIVGLSIFGYANCRQSPLREMTIKESKGNQTRYMLPANATQIRDPIVHDFSCEGKSYGYYADTSNDCQIFHVCRPIEYDSKLRSSRKPKTLMYDFICNDGMQFNQEVLTCVPPDDMTINCEDSANYYDANQYMMEPDKAADMSPNALMMDGKDRKAPSPFSKSGVSEKLLQKVSAALLLPQDAVLLEPYPLGEDQPLAVELPTDTTVPDSAEDEGEEATTKRPRRGFLFKADAANLL